MKLRIGTRGSHLARIQAGNSAARLARLGHETEIVAIATAGDRSSAPTFAAIGPQGVFVREIEQALIDGTIDVAVHSHKDLPTTSPDELAVGAVPERRDPADALVIRGDRAGAARSGSLLPVPEGALVGTASVRRQVWLGHFRPDLEAESLRGNVLTRIRRLREGRYDAILLASAGLDRLRAGAAEGVPALDLGGLAVVRLDPGVFVPAPAQGALALQCRRTDVRVRDALAPLDHAPTRAKVEAERALLARLEGGCELAFGAWCEHAPGTGGRESVMVAMVETGGEVRRAASRGSRSSGARGGPVANPLGRPGGDRRPPVKGPDRVSAFAGRRILLTRDEEDSAAWAAEIASLGAVPVLLPCIECRDIDTPDLRSRLAAELPRARWLAFTSRRGVASFARLRGARTPDREAGREPHREPHREANQDADREPARGPEPGALPDGVKVAAVGPATARAAAATLGRVDLAGGAGGTAGSLAGALVPRLEAGDRVLIAVAENAGRAFEETVRSAGRACTRLDVYRTVPVPVPERAARRAASSLGADAVLLASPSAVAGFVNQVRLDRAPGIFTIGPSTTEAARAAGLEVTAEAPRPGLRGLLEAMRCET